MAPLDRGQVKGGLLVHLRAFVTERAGTDGWNELESRLEPMDAEIWGALILVSSWYPVGAWNRALSAFAQPTAAPAAAIGQLGHYVAEHDFNTVFRVLLRAASPEFILSRTNSLWARYFDTGALRAAQLAEKRWLINIEAPLEEESAPSRFTCLAVGPWIEHALAMSGAKHGRVVQTKCRFDGIASCHFEATW